MDFFWGVRGIFWVNNPSGKLICHWKFARNPIISVQTRGRVSSRWHCTNSAIRWACSTQAKKAQLCCRIILQSIITSSSIRMMWPEYSRCTVSSFWNFGTKSYNQIPFVPQMFQAVDLSIESRCPQWRRPPNCRVVSQHPNGNLLKCQTRATCLTTPSLSSPTACLFLERKSVNIF